MPIVIISHRLDGLLVYAKLKRDMRKNLVIVSIIICVIYLINPTLGVFELIPDNLPLIGNIDEVFVAGLLLSLINFLRTGEFRLLKQSRKKNDQ